MNSSGIRTMRAWTSYFQPRENTWSRNLIMNTKVVERSILYYTNKERKKRGLKPLKGQYSLIRAARGHSRWMARRNKFSHTGGGGSQPWHRARKAGYQSTSVSENIWQASGGSGLAWKSKFLWKSSRRLGQAAVISWMNSPGHRGNLLDPKWNHIGIGVARNKRGRIYLTQNFGSGQSIAKSPGGTSFWGWFIIGMLIVLGVLAFINWGI